MIGMFIALALMGADTPPSAGQQTSIAFASGDGLRDWQSGPPDSNTVYVRDRTDHWYQVALTGPRARNAASETFTYTTDATSTFDRFAHVSTIRNPTQVCGVTSIIRSDPPPNMPGASKR